MKTSELTGAQLDWAVGAANGEKLNVGFRNLTYTPKGKRTVYKYLPSTSWAQGGPIIEHERILIQPELGKEGCGNAWNAISMHDTDAYGPTPLIAAMRCYVALKLGDDVEIPKELS